MIRVKQTEKMNYDINKVLRSITRTDLAKLIIPKQSDIDKLLMGKDLTSELQKIATSFRKS